MTHVDGAVEPQRRRKRAKKLPRHAYDRRKRLGRRITTLAEAFRQHIGLDEVAADPVLAASVERAARLTALAEELSARALRGEQVSIDDTIRAARVADLAVRRLHLDRHKKPDGPTLGELFGHEHEP